jgi:5-oxoprolinase (ATP-hydrolysing) subunit A
VVARAVTMVTARHVVATDGSTIAIEADTLCVHGDTPGSADLVREIRRGLEAAGVAVAALRP